MVVHGLGAPLSTPRKPDRIRGDGGRHRKPHHPSPLAPRHVTRGDSGRHVRARAAPATSDSSPFASHADDGFPPVPLQTPPPTGGPSAGGPVHSDELRSSSLAWWVSFVASRGIQVWFTRVSLLFFFCSDSFSVSSRAQKFHPFSSSFSLAITSRAPSLARIAPLLPRGNRVLAGF